MPKLSLVKGTTSYSAYIIVRDSSVTTGAGKTGLAYNTAGLVAYYVRPRATATAITLATQTVTGAFSSGGFVEVDATNTPGLYRLDVPDLALASGVNAVVVMLKGAANMAQVELEIELTGIDNQNATSAGLSNLDAAITSRSTATALTTAQADLDDIQTRLPSALVSGRIDASVGAMAANTMTAAAAAADLTTELQSGLATGAALTTAQADLDDIQARLPATLISGRIDATVGAMAANVVTAAAAAADLTTELQTGLATAANLATLTGYVDTEVAAIKAKTDALPALPAAVGDIPTAIQNADALLDRANAIELGLTPRQAQRLIAAAAAGILSGAATTTITIRNAVADSKNRIIATVDADGNRSAITVDLS